MKCLRLGNTEFNLIFAHFCEQYCDLNDDEKKEIYNIRRCYIDWLYKTAGYYDKNVEIQQRYNYPEHYTDNFKLYIEQMLECIRDSEYVVALGYRWMINNNHILLKYMPDLKSKFNSNLEPGNFDARFTINAILNKPKVLVISPFKELIDEQISNGNFAKIQPKLASSTFITFKFPYTFLNNGPHNNSFETLEEIKKDLKDNYNDFDIAILSCGSYGSFLVDFIDKELKKDVAYIGGQLPLVFGIIGKRDKWAINELYGGNTTYLINGVPEKYRPTGWEKIEDGCYW